MQRRCVTIFIQLDFFGGEAFGKADAFLQGEVHFFMIQSVAGRVDQETPVGDGYAAPTVQKPDEIRSAPFAGGCGAFGADGSGDCLLVRPDGGSRVPYTPESELSMGWFVKMDGRPVFKWAVRLLEDTSYHVLEAAGYTKEDVKAWLWHQAVRSARPRPRTERQIKLTSGKVPTSFCATSFVPSVEPLSTMTTWAG